MPLLSMFLKDTQKTGEGNDSDRQKGQHFKAEHAGGRSGCSQLP